MGKRSCPQKPDRFVRPTGIADPENGLDGLAWNSLTFLKRSMGKFQRPCDPVPGAVEEADASRGLPLAK